MAAVGLAARAVTASGALVGAVLGILIAWGAGVEGWLLLITMFGLVVAATKVGAAHRMSSSGLPAEGETRGGRNAIANAGVAAIAAVIWRLTHWSPALAGMAAALVASGSDSVASEIGQSWGRTTWHLTKGRVPAGTPGGVSVVGTTAGGVSTLALSGVAAIFHLIALEDVVPLAMLCTATFLFEGAVLSRLEDAGQIDNHVVNFLSSLVAAGLAGAYVRFWG